ncbi:nuclear transport factor 2 family protein [Devosia rhizoryzae]|uniref:Nuclear transport factor 2 family protein n=1 Tax=Devosia rhizoryzae TaxID=2774137 RepID=A0ABX7C8L9_9HYPH|nr:nuclear transport factor 2 family protein [Devosia rhizoryzae]QQR39042.1 nuclear transport factor 2 family protein [Devosia rhizoryzae]
MPRILSLATAAIIALSTASAALAGPALDMAQTRIDAIAKGDIDTVTGAYSADATLGWVGGPLDGTYNTPEAIAEVWTKFATAQGEQTVEMGDAWEATNPKGSTVAVNVTFKGAMTVPVLYVLTYRDGKLVDEIWQVNPPAQ